MDQGQSSDRRRPPTVRLGTPSDIEPAIAVWKASITARRAGRPVPPEHEAQVWFALRKPDAFLLVAEDADAIVGMALGMQGLADEGAGPPVPGLTHVSLVFVAPGRWGEGIGGCLIDAVLDEARLRGYTRAQLWTHADNARGQRLYEGRRFWRSGREKDDAAGERIVHFEREL